MKIIAKCSDMQWEFDADPSAFQKGDGFAFRNNNEILYNGTIENRVFLLREDGKIILALDIQ